MTKTLFIDKFSFTPSARSYTSEGYLIAPAKIARPGMQLYRGIDLMASPGFPADKFSKDSVVKVYRPAEEVFDQASINSFKNVAVTNEHPPQLLNARTHRKYAVGLVLSDVQKDEASGCLSATIKVTDADTIQNINDGKCEVSAGYLSEVVFEDGTTPSGEKYDAIQKGIEGNHVAIVDKGRAGDKIRLADNQMVMEIDKPKIPTLRVSMDGVMYDLSPESKSYARIGQMMKDSEAEFIREAKIEKDETRAEVEDEDYNEVNAGKPNKEEPVQKTTDEGQMEPMVTLPKDKTIMHDGKSVKNKEGSLSLETKLKEKTVELQEKYDALKIKFSDLETVSAQNKAAADVAETALGDAKAKIPTVDQIDVLVAERATVVAKCKGLVEDLEIAGKSNADLMKEVVGAKMAHVDVKTVSDAYVEAAFDLLKVDVKETKKVETKDSLTNALSKEVSDGKQKEDSARAEFMKRTRDAWK